MLLTDAQAAYAGDAALASIYMGDTLVWSSAPPSLYDPATQAFLDATGLDESFAPALDGLVLSLKDAGLWSKMKAVYPFIGGTADLHKWNLMDPRDANNAYRLTFIGSSTSHTQALGYRANPTPAQGGYADTHLVPSTTLDPASVHMALYSLTTMVECAPLRHGQLQLGWNGRAVSPDRSLHIGRASTTASGMAAPHPSASPPAATALGCTCPAAPTSRPKRPIATGRRWGPAV